MVVYRVIYDTLWTGETGRLIRKLIQSGKAGHELWAVFIYLITSPHTNMLGVYRLPMSYLINDLGSSSEGASEPLRRALKSLCEAGFCRYDEETEIIWIVEFARFQVGKSLSPNDNKVKAVRKEFISLSKSPFLQEFWNKYGKAYHLPSPAEVRGFEAPLEPLQSQEQEQEQEQDLETPSSPEPACGDSEDARPSQPIAALPDKNPQPSICDSPPTVCNCPHDQIIDLYHEILPSLPKIRVWSEHNRKTLRARWRESTERQNLDWWRSYFERVQASDFLTGRAKEWSATLEWLVGPKNFNKVLNGQYDNRTPVAGAIDPKGSALATDPLHLLAEWAGDNWLRRIIARGLGELIADKRKGAPRGQEVVYAAGLYEQMLIRKQIALSPEVDAKRITIGFKTLFSEVSGWPEAKQLIPLIRHRPPQERLEEPRSQEDINLWKNRFAEFSANH